MDAGVGSRLGVGIGRKAVVGGSVSERRIKSDAAKGGVLPFNGSDEETGEMVETGDGNEACRRGHASGKRKTWNQSDIIQGVSQIPVHDKSDTQESGHTTGFGEISNSWTDAGSEDTVPKDSQDSCRFAEKTPTKFRKRSECSDVELMMEMRPVQRRQLKLELGKSSNDACKNGVGNEDFMDRSFKGETDRKKRLDTKEVYAAEQKLIKLMDDNQRTRSATAHSSTTKHQKPVAESSLFHSDIKKSSSVLRKPNLVNPVSNVTRHHPKTIPHEVQEFAAWQSRLQCIVDLMMWRHTSRSAFILLFGTIIFISLSYTEHLNISFLSVFAYLGLGYLALMFIYSPLLSREAERSIKLRPDTVLSEEEAMKILKIVLPYLNKIVLALKSLFSGDPDMTMQLAIALFVLIRWGSFITIWNITMLGFYVSLILPKLYSMCSMKLNKNGEYWVQRMHIVRRLCYKNEKTLATVAFLLIWNLCSTSTGIEALFMLLVAVPYYQQSVTAHIRQGDRILR